MMTRSMFPVVVLLATSSAWAERPTLTASAGLASQVFTNRSYDLLSSQDHLPMARISAGAAFELPQGSLDVELAFQTGGSEGTAHANVPTTFWLRGLELGATWRYPLFKHLHPYAHLGAGWDWATVTLTSEARLTQTVGTPSAGGLLGLQLPFDLRTGSGRAPTLIFDLGVGYVLRPTLGFHSLSPKPPEKPGIDPLVSGSVDLGSLALSGVAWRVGATVRF